MPRILGVDIPERNKLVIALQRIYGVGPFRAAEICARLNLDPDRRVREMTEADIGLLNKYIQDHYTVEGDLRRQVAQDVRRLMAINCYRGMRHKRSLPVRGQRTKTNARTRKGSKRTVGAIRDKTMRKLAKA
jgi:small subunit ribosomal protein S13